MQQLFVYYSAYHALKHRHAGLCAPHHTTLDLVVLVDGVDAGPPPVDATWEPSPAFVARAMGYIRAFYRVARFV